MPYVRIRNETAKNRAFLSAVHKEVKKEEKEEKAQVPNTPGYMLSVVLGKIWNQS